MSKIQVLALNDDNHDICFVTRDSYYYNAISFMQDCLLKPHTSEYEIGYVSLFDLSDNKKIMFDKVASEYIPNILFCEEYEIWMEREEAFNYLWSISDKKYFYT